MKNLVLFRILSLAALMASATSAEIVASDDFNSYAVGALVGQGPSGSGWGGGWVAGNTTEVNADLRDTSGSGALNITPPGGTTINGGARALDIYPPAGVGGAGKSGIVASRQLQTARTGTFYAGYVIKWQAGVFNSNDTVALHFTNDPADSSSGFNFGYRGLPGTYGVMARQGTGSPVAGAFSTFSASTNDTVRHLVAKFEKVASTNYNKITVWINPTTTSETDLPSGDCQILSTDSGISSIDSVNLRVENLKGPDATSNGDDKVSIDSLAITTTFEEVVTRQLPIAPTGRPFIWVRDSEKTAINAKIASSPWATSVFNAMVARVAPDVASHQANRDSFLRELPILWNQSPPIWNAIGLTGTESSTRGPAQSKLDLAQDCAVLFYLTGDLKYARCAADILHNSVQAYLNLPTGTNSTNGGWLFQDDLLKEARVTGTQLPIVYDFLHAYLTAGYQVYSVPAAGMVDFSFTDAQFVFRKFYERTRITGKGGSNWFSLKATCMVQNLLALDDATERSTALQTYLTGAGGPNSNQGSLHEDAQAYVQDGDIWPESLQYSGGVGNNDTILMILLERYDPSLQLFSSYPNLPKSLSRASYLRYPNGEQVSFGDGHRTTEGQPFLEYEATYQHAQARGLTDLTQLYGSLINGGVAAGEYNRSSLADYGSLGRHDEPTQLLWFAPAINESGQSLELPRTDVLPFAGLALQRNPSTPNNEQDGLMAFVGGAAHVHSHASGMSMELYGKGQVLGAKSGRTSYGATENENYYRVFASNNTVIVNGASRGEGGWKSLAINTVQVAAMEPAAFQPPVSPNHSFTCSTFQDNKGTLAEAAQQRTVSIVRTSPTTGYYVDIFRSDSSKASEYHDYIYRNVGDSVSIETSTGPLALTSQPSRFQSDIGDANEQPGWRYFEDTEVSSSTPESVMATFAASLPAGQIKMDLHIPGATGREYAKVTSPKIVDAPSPYDNRRAPTLVIRQNGEAWNRPFAVVFEPYIGSASTVRNVTKLEKNGVLVGLKVESNVGGNDIVHYVISNPGATDTYSDPSIGLSFTGRFAVVTDNGDFSGSLYIGQGSDLQYKGLGLASVSGSNTQANADFAAGQAPVITSNAPMNFTTSNQPTISSVPDQSLLVNSVSASISFTLGDANVPATSLVVTAESSNPALIPVGGIALSGTGEARSVVLTPLVDQTGTSLIRLTVDNGLATSFTEFLLTVSPAYDFAGTLVSGAADCGIKEAPALESETAGSAIVGTGGNSPWVDRCLVFVFRLPDFGPVSNPFGPVSFAFQYTGKTGTPPVFDLYGLGRRDLPVIAGTDYYGQTSVEDPTDAILLQASALNSSTPIGSVTTDAGGSLALCSYLNAAYQSGAGAGKFVLLRLNTAVPKSGVNRANITMSEGGVTSPSDTRPRIEYLSSAVVLTPQESWRVQHFGTSANTGDAGDAMDPNHDGENNLLEYATGQNPLATTFAATPVTMGGTDILFNYPRGLAALSSGYIFSVEWSDSLLPGTWSSAGVTEQIVSDDGVVQSVDATVPAGATRRFIRLRTTKP